MTEEIIQWILIAALCIAMAVLGIIMASLSGQLETLTSAAWRHRDRIRLLEDAEAQREALVARTEE